MKPVLTLILLASSLSLAAQNDKSRSMTGEENAKKAIRNAIAATDYKPFYDTLIKDKETAIAVAEPILFKIYGKKNIIAEKPYECYLIDGYWYIAGTLPKNSIGGVFEIIINSKDGKRLRDYHFSRKN